MKKWVAIADVRSVSCRALRLPVAMRTCCLFEINSGKIAERFADQLYVFNVAHKAVRISMF